MEHPSKEKPVLSVRVDKDLLDRVDRLCERTGVSRVEIVERCLVLGLDDEEEMVRWLENRIAGPVLHVLTHPKLLDKVLRLVSAGELGADPTQAKIHEGVAKRRRSGKSSK